VNSAKKPIRLNPLIVLFTYLLNLVTMSSHVPAYDAFLGRFLYLALMDYNDRPPIQAFQDLKELSILSEWARPSWDGPGIPNNRYRLGLEYLAPGFSLPRLKKLAIFGLDVEDTLHYCGPRAGTSSIIHLTLVNHEYSTAMAPETQAILAMPKALISLSFYQNDCGLVPLGPEDPLPISNAQISRWLCTITQYISRMPTQECCRRNNVIYIRLKFGADHEF
jgi:hypothetical protein